MTADGSSRVTALLRAVEDGEERAIDALLPAVYDELRALASSLMQAEPPGHTLQPTALVHEAFVRLAGDTDRSWSNRRHFYNAACMAMRRVLVDRARKAQSAKRGGGRKRTSIDLVDFPITQDFDLEQMDQVDTALSELGQQNERMMEVVQLRYFAGLTIEQAAETLGVSPATVKEDWKFARAWLQVRLNGLIES